MIMRLPRYDQESCPCAEIDHKHLQTRVEVFGLSLPLSPYLIPTCSSQLTQFFLSSRLHAFAADILIPVTACILALLLASLFFLAVIEPGMGQTLVHCANSTSLLEFDAGAVRFLLVAPRRTGEPLRQGSSETQTGAPPAPSTVVPKSKGSGLGAADSGAPVDDGAECSEPVQSLAAMVSMFSLLDGLRELLAETFKG